MIVIDEGNIRRGSINDDHRRRRDVRRHARAGRSSGAADSPGDGTRRELHRRSRAREALLKTAVGTAVEAERTDRVGIAEAIAILERPASATGAPAQSALADCSSASVPASTIRRRSSGAGADSRAWRERFYATARSRAASTMLALREIVDRLALSSDPKTVVLITEGVLVGRNFADTAWVPERTAAAAVSLYGLRVDNEQFDAAMPRISPTRRADRELLVEGLDHVVGLARGTVFPLGANPQATFARLNLELSGTTCSRSSPRASDRDGKAHQISIGVSRRGVTCARGVSSLSMPVRRGKPVDARLMDVLKSPLLLSDFGLQVTTFTYRDPESAKLKVLVAARDGAGARCTGESGASSYYVTDEKKTSWRPMSSRRSTRPGPPSPHRSGTSPARFWSIPACTIVKLAVIDGDGRARLDRAHI